MRGVQNLEVVALGTTSTVPLPLGDPSTQRSMNRVVAQQELERQNFRVRGSGGDAVFRPADRWLRPPLPVTVRLTQGTPHPPAQDDPGGGNDALNPPSSPSTASLSGVARCWHSNAYFSLFATFLRPTEQICPDSAGPFIVSILLALLFSLKLAAGFSKREVVQPNICSLEYRDAYLETHDTDAALRRECPFEPWYRDKAGPAAPASGATIAAASNSAHYAGSSPLRAWAHLVLPE